MTAQDLLDLARLDTVAAQLHLAVAAAGELDSARSQPADEIAGAIETLSRPAGERIGHELRRRELRLIRIVAGQPIAAHVQLAEGADRHRLQPAIEHVNPRVRDGTADRDRAAGRRRLRHLLTTGERGVFRRSIAIDQTNSGLLAQQLFNPGRGEHVTPRQEMLEAREAFDSLVHHLVEEARGEPQGGDRMLRDGPLQPFGGEVFFGVEDQPAAVEQRSPDLQGGSVEGGRRRLEEDLLFAQRDVGILLHQTDHAAMRNPHPLWTTGRAGGVHQVGRACATSAHTRERRLPGEGMPRLVQEDHRGSDSGKTSRQVPFRQEHGSSAVLDHEGEPLLRVGQVQGDEGPTGLEDSQQRDHHLRLALQVDRHWNLGPDAAPPEIGRELS